MKNIKIDIKKQVCIIYIDRLKSYNSINIDVIDELTDFLSKYSESKEFRSVILTGVGEQAFIAGADIKAMSTMNDKEALYFSKAGNDLTLLMDNYPKPIIAAINGYALGGGCEFAMACHIRFCSENAIIGQPETGLGLIPGFGGTQRLSRIVGLSSAYDLLLSGRSINSSEAKEIGLVSKVFKIEELLEESIKFAEKINKNSPTSSKLIIELVNKGAHLSLEEALNLESKYFQKIFSHKNKDIGIKAFLDKTTPNFED